MWSFIIRKIGLFKKINKISWESINWYPSEAEKGKYFTDKYPRNECWIKMNDFPEESLWTLFYKGDFKYIEDTPVSWRIFYSNDSEINRKQSAD